MAAARSRGGTGNDFSRVVTISHGLGATPLCVLAVFSQSTFDEPEDERTKLFLSKIL